MSQTHFDFIVIGGGSAGYAAASKAQSLGKSVAIIDGAKTLGGLCILKGCMPSKTLIYTTEILHHINNAKTFAINTPSPNVDRKALIQRKREIIDDFAQYRTEQLLSNRFTLFRNFAHFTNSNEIQLNDGKKLTGDKFLIATGSKIVAPPIPGLDSTPSFTSDDILDMDDIPESMIILGGGIIACELGQYLNRLGCKVTQIQRSHHILKEGSSQASTVVENVFKREGINLFTNTQLLEVGQKNGKFFATFNHNGQTITQEASGIFNALGRKPNTDSLNLQAAGVELETSGHIQASPLCQTTNPNIYAAGDCTGPHEIVHVAILQGECAVDHAFNSKETPINYNHLLKVIFTDPQIAFVGLNEEELKAQNIPFLSDDYPFDDHGKSILMEAKDGYVKILAHKENGQILGAECVSKDASELIHSLSVAISLKATVFDLLKTHWYHPTLSEIWTYPLETIADEIHATHE